MQHIYAAAMTAMATILHGGTDPAQQQHWADRLQRDIEMVLADENVAPGQRRHPVMLAGMGLARAGRVAEAIAVSRKVLGEDWPAAAMLIAAEQSEADDIEGALKTCSMIRGDVQQRALTLVAVRQAQRGDHNEAMKLVERVSPRFRDGALKRIAQAMIEDGKIQMAVRAQRMVADTQLREDIRQFYLRRRDAPDPAAPDFEARSVAEARDAWGSLGFSDEDEQLVRLISRAKVALHEKNGAEFKRIMRQAVDLTDDPGVQFALAALYDAGGESDAALQLLRGVLRTYMQTESEFNLFRILSSEDLTKLLARRMPVKELHQWVPKLAEAGSIDMIAGIGAGLAAKGKFADVDRIYQTLSEPSHRVELTANVLLAEVDWKP
jgi:hypothetical protein